MQLNLTWNVKWGSVMYKNKNTDDEEPQISYSEYNTFLSLKYNRRFS